MIPVPRGWSPEQAWEAIKRGDVLTDPDPRWANVEVLDGRFVQLHPCAPYVSPEVIDWLKAENECEQPHSLASLIDGEWQVGCWCGEIHDPDYEPGSDDEWEPFTVADLRDLYADASRARKERAHWLRWRLRYAKWRIKGGGPL